MRPLTVAMTLFLAVGMLSLVLGLSDMDPLKKLNEEDPSRPFDLFGNLWAELALMLAVIIFWMWVFIRLGKRVWGDTTQGFVWGGIAGLGANWLLWMGWHGVRYLLGLM